MRTLCVGIAVLTLACSGALGDPGWDTGGGPRDVNITVGCNVPSFAQVLWNDTSGDAVPGDRDLTIAFGSSADWTLGPDADDGVGGSDGDGALGYYSLANASSHSGDWPSGEQGWCEGKKADEAWAHAWFEADDYVQVYIHTNTDISMTLTPGGLLSDGAGHTLPSWFTMAGYCLTPTPGGFLLAGTTYTGGNAPFAAANTDGRYLEPGAGGTVVPGGGIYGVYPDQWCFPMNSGSRFLDADAPTQGTITFHARLFRNGMNDVAGNYTGSIPVTFAAP